MKLSSRTRYGIKAILEIAREHGNGPIQIKTIAEREDISNKYLEQLIAMLKMAGLIRSMRGPRGGYMLAKPPSEIPIKDVFWALEGQMEPVECMEHARPIPGCADCATSRIWQELKDSIVGVMEKVTLADLLE